MNDGLKERMLQGLAANAQRTGEIEGLDISQVPWPEIEHYGSQHHRFVSQLAFHIGGTLGLNEVDLQIVRAAGLCHDLGRTKTWQEAEPGHGLASSRIAERLLYGHPNKDRICQLIANHAPDGLDGGVLPTDPMLIALWDAECYESARLAPQMPVGLEVMRRRMDRVVSAWAKEADYKQRWMQHRGW